MSLNVPVDRVTDHGIAFDEFKNTFVKDIYDKNF